MKKLIEGIQGHIGEAVTHSVNAMSRRARDMYSQTAELHKDWGRFASDLRGTAKSVERTDPEYAGELAKKADIIEGAMKSFGDLESTIGSLKMGKGRW